MDCQVSTLDSRVEGTSNREEAMQRNMKREGKEEKEGEKRDSRVGLQGESK